LLEIAKKRAEEDSLAKSRFVAMASHDLRQPLHAMHLLVENLESEVPVSQLPAVRRVKESVRQLNQLMSEVLDISKINFGIVKVTKSHFSLSRLCFRIFREYEEECQEKNIQLMYSVADNLWVYSDPILLERIIRNLVVNAIHHSAASQISVVSGVQSEQIRLLVTDNGRGIPRADQRLIFEEFQQSVAGKENRSGLGLGLAIVRQFAELLGAGLQLDSDEGAGCRFSLSLEKGRAETDVPGDKPGTGTDATSRRYQNQNRSHGQAPKIIVVDDNSDAGSPLAALLRYWGYSVRCYTAPGVVLAEATDAPDLLLTDYHLQSDYTGMELIQLLRQRFNQAIPAILMTADTDLAASLVALESMSIVTKPVMPGQLRLLLSDHLG
jgi:CheY-like chemotaxis protein